LFSKACILLSFALFSVNASHPYDITGHTNALTSLSLLLLLILLFLHILNAFVVMFMPIAGLAIQTYLQ